MCYSKADLHVATTREPNIAGAQATMSDGIFAGGVQVVDSFSHTSKLLKADRYTAAVLIQGLYEVSLYSLGDNVEMFSDER
mmetsp:Transcript_40653/g.102335  ORF Transcript_40653/g.102335 Transcript_40653/m.102335 type:complete len:81 (-) Transcript_40653:426-668(-)